MPMKLEDVMPLEPDRSRLANALVAGQGLQMPMGQDRPRLVNTHEARQA